METQQHKMVVHSDDDFLFEVEANSEGLFLHCEVFNWKPSVLKKTYQVFGEFLNGAQQAGISKIYTVTPNPKFAKLYGGQVVNRGYIDNVLHEVIVWENLH